MILPTSALQGNVIEDKQTLGLFLDRGGDNEVGKESPSAKPRSLQQADIEKRLTKSTKEEK